MASHIGWLEQARKWEVLAEGQEKSPSGGLIKSNVWSPQTP
jgi:hypothetical protein